MYRSVMTFFFLNLGILVIESCAEKKSTESRTYDEFDQLFNGVDLTGWKGDKPYWRVENGILIGEITDSTLVSANKFLIYQGRLPDNFELLVEFKVSENGNSGINYRSEKIEGLDYYALRGYQYDIDGQMNYTGSNYEEKKRSTLASIGESVVVPNISPDDSLYFNVSSV